MAEVTESVDQGIQESTQEPTASEAENCKDVKSGGEFRDAKNVGSMEPIDTESQYNEDSAAEDDDVPSDFFDDFSNQDFMAGLDIVDVWDEDDLQEENKRSHGYRNERRLLHRKPRQHFSRSPYRSHRSRNFDRRYHPVYGSKDREYKHRSIKSKDRRKEKETKESEVVSRSDCRRDPEKTKRDIQRDKRDKEAKIISEKLKVVETGLVPPGMEMEIDLKQLNTVNEEDRKCDLQREESSKQFKETRVSYESRRNALHQKRRRSRSMSFKGNRSHYAVRERHYSPFQHLVYDSDRTYDRRTNFHSRSPYRQSRSRSPYDHRYNIDRRYVEERRAFYHYRDTERRRRSREYSNLSPISNVSERELWLRQRDYRRERNISCSPISDDEMTNRRQSNDFLEELASKLNSDKKKKTLLKEIHEKLNETSVIEPHYPMMSVSVSNSDVMPMMPQPQPVPAPSFVASQPHYFSHSIDTDPYDEQFFIGQPNTFPSSYMDSQYMVPHSDPNCIENVSLPPNIVSITEASNSLEHPVLPHINNNIDILKMQRTAKDHEVITKLFEDKKISLSDFLSMSTDYVDPSQPIQVQKKVKVISLCQDAINALSDDSKLNGRFFLKKICKEVEKKEDIKFQSPMKKIPVVRFRFTTLSKGDEKSSLHSTLNKLLASLSLIKPPIHRQLALSPIDSESSVPSVKSSSPKLSKPRKRKYDPILGAKFQMKMCQTDPVKCHICEIRKARKYEDKGVQYETAMVDSATQISEEDIQRFGLKTPMKNALKNQSLVHLTPAQILAAQEESNILPPAKMITSPCLQTPSPCKNNPHANDSFTNHSEYRDRYRPNPFRVKNNAGRGKKIVGLMDKIVPNPFENAGNSSSNPPRFDNGPNPNPKQPGNKLFLGNRNFKQTTFDEDDFDQPAHNYSNDPPRSFLPSNRGSFGSRGGRKF